MKKAIVFVCLFAFVLPLVGCGSDTVQAEPVPAENMPRKGGGGGGAAIPTKGIND